MVILFFANAFLSPQNYSFFKTIPILFKINHLLSLVMIVADIVTGKVYLLKQSF